MVKGNIAQDFQSDKYPREFPFAVKSWVRAIRCPNCDKIRFAIKDAVIEKCRKCLGQEFD